MQMADEVPERVSGQIANEVLEGSGADGSGADG